MEDLEPDVAPEGPNPRRKRRRGQKPSSPDEVLDDLVQDALGFLRRAPHLWTAEIRVMNDGGKVDVQTIDPDRHHTSVKVVRLGVATLKSLRALDGDAHVVGRGDRER